MFYTHTHAHHLVNVVTLCESAGTAAEFHKQSDEQFPVYREGRGLGEDGTNVATMTSGQRGHRIAWACIGTYKSHLFTKCWPVCRALRALYANRIGVAGSGDSSRSSLYLSTFSMIWLWAVKVLRVVRMPDLCLLSDNRRVASGNADLGLTDFAYTACLLKFEHHLFFVRSCLHASP